MKIKMPLIFIYMTALLIVLIRCSAEKKREIKEKPRVIISTDIGGTDPDDYQSMIHYLMYADKFQTEGLIASPFGEGRKEHILKVIDLYEKDLPKLSKHSDFPSAESLRAVVKQGGVDKVSSPGWSKPTEGSKWIITKANEESDQPLWILVWGGIEDVAQALHDAPEIVSKIRVYWIGGPNKKWSVHSYYYIARNFPDLWMIEANATYRGWFFDAYADLELTNENFYRTFIKDKGAFGVEFGNHYKGSIKMGDTPSVAYLLNGNADDPTGESWGGSFTPLPNSAVRNFNRNTLVSDTIPTYSILELEFDSGETETIENPEIWMEIAGQRIDGFYEGKGIYKVRFVPKQIGNWKYKVHCPGSEKINGQNGEFVSTNPWPGNENPDNLKLSNWWSDRPDEEFYLSEYQGAKTIAKWREDYLRDWAKRFSWLDE